MVLAVECTMDCAMNPNPNSQDPHSRSGLDARQHPCIFQVRAWIHQQFAHRSHTVVGPLQSYFRPGELETLNQKSSILLSAR